jgi:hypothetical protein
MAFNPHSVACWCFFQLRSICEKKPPPNQIIDYFHSNVEQLAHLFTLARRHRRRWHQIYYDFHIITLCYAICVVFFFR